MADPAIHERTTRELARAYEELQCAVDELERANDELVATSRELEATNRELQSANEELETVNRELRGRTEEALRANAFCTSVLAGVRQSVVVLDPDQRVTVWNEAAFRLWGLRAEEVEGRRFLDLDTGLPAAALRAPLRETLAGRRPAAAELEARDGRGRRIRLEVTFAPLGPDRDHVEGVLLLISAGTLES